MTMQDVAHSAPSKPLPGLPLPMQPRGRAQRLLAGMQRLQALYDEMAAKVIIELDAMDAGTEDLEDDEREAVSEDEGAQCDDEGVLDNEDGCAIEDGYEGGEYTLGWSEADSISGHLSPGCNDLEPSLGSLENVWQMSWGGFGPPGRGGDIIDAEFQCEDEGHDSDREPEEDDDQIAESDRAYFLQHYPERVSP